MCGWQLGKAVGTQYIGLFLCLILFYLFSSVTTVRPGAMRRQLSHTSFPKKRHWTRLRPLFHWGALRCGAPFSLLLFRQVWESSAPLLLKIFTTRCIAPNSLFRRAWTFFLRIIRRQSSDAQTIMETNPIPILTIQTTPFDDQRPGTNGLRKKTAVFESKKNYLQNYIQSVLSSIDLRDRQGCTMVVGSDGRYFSRTATEVIVQMAAANGVRCVIVCL